MTAKPNSRVPSRSGSVVFRCKASLLQLRRGLFDIAGGVRRWSPGELSAFPHVLAESRTPLWIEESLAERGLQWGKVHNLRCALHSLNGVVLPANGLFSFWKQVGQATRRRGYVPGRQLQEGCLIPAIGGGLCQLSNALYEVALQTGCTIVERHAHTQIVPGSAAAAGRDAAIAWNYKDLRFRPSQPVLLETLLTRDALIVRLRGKEKTQPQPHAIPRGDASPATRTTTPNAPTRLVLDAAKHSCVSCGQDACFRHDSLRGSRIGKALQTQRLLDTEAGRTAYLVDERWPEFQRYLTMRRRPGDVLGVPLDGERWHQTRYRWDTAGYAHVGAATWQTLHRSLTARRLGRYGAARLQAQLDDARALARRLARELSFDITQVCVAQSLLPFLWRDGHLGGRHFEVLMTRLPLQTLHSRLNAACAEHPDRRTLAEFRAPDWLVAAEAEALLAADRIVTPHTDIAALFPDQVLLLDWHLPSRAPAASGARIAFPGPTAARKGAYELRDVARALNRELLLLGSELEGDDFWQGVTMHRVDRSSGADWLSGVAAVVQPALVEDQPRPLLAALAAGIPVITTPACGLGDRPGVTTVPYGDAAALCAAIRRVCE